MKLLGFILAFLTLEVYLHAEEDLIIENDSLQTSSETVSFLPYSKLIIPTVFISYGALTHAIKPLQQFDKHIDNEVSRHFTKRRRMDDVLQFIPVSAVYGLDWMGIKAKNNFRDRTFVVLTSHIIMGATVQTIKITTGIERPDGSNHHSFPSGHTATAFAGAHILFKEYKDVTPWIGVAGYATATTVGTMRILNRKHWLSDVVTGAGIGILSAEIGYLLLPVFHKIIGAEQNQYAMSVTPIIGANHYGIGMVWVF
jgi:membrane-associated PAP2 superfamily phosphatase